MQLKQQSLLDFSKRLVLCAHLGSNQGPKDYESSIGNFIPRRKSAFLTYRGQFTAFFQERKIGL